MERAVLGRLLAAGLSLEEIGKREGKHPSTVAYWLNRHGLRAAGAGRFAGKGGLRREPLLQLVDERLTLKEMSMRLGVSIATVRYWLQRHSIARDDRRRNNEAPSAPEVVRECPRHGSTRFVREARGYYRCGQCRLEAVSDWRRRTKAKLVAEAGGRCLICGYDRYLGALQFHHLNPQQKRFSLSVRGVTRSIVEIRAEAAKCALLCANCHAEVEGGIAKLPIDQSRQDAVA